MVYGLKTLDNMALIDLCATYPHQLLTVVLKGDAKAYYNADFLKSNILIVINPHDGKQFQHKAECTSADPIRSPPENMVWLSDSSLCSLHKHRSGPLHAAEISPELHNLRL